MVGIEARSRLTPAETEAVLELVSHVTAVDGLAPLSEHVMLHLRHGGDRADQHFLALDDGVIVGYAHLDTTDAVNGPSAELAVEPARRKHGIGHAIVESLLMASPDGRLRLWAHGEQAAARSLAESLGFRSARVLWQMRRSLRLPLPAVEPPAGVRIRSFRPGQDEPGWLALNARAFADHPEQGAWSAVDLERRMAEPWFSADGFLVAEADGVMAGFHWTKVHGGEDAHHAHEAIGEVYVVGVDPAWHGRGLGHALTVAGLAHLRDRGLDQAMLYVDAGNAPAIRLYQSLGFTRWDTDIEFHRTP